MRGAIVGWAYNRRAAGAKHHDAARRFGVLLASGLIVGESLCGVLYAGIIVASVARGGSATPAALPFISDAFANGPAVVLGAIAYLASIYFLYRWTGNLADKKLES